LIGVDGSIKLGLVKLDLVSKAAVTGLVERFLNEFINDGADNSSMLVNADNVTVIDHELLVCLLFGGPEALKLVDLAELSDHLEEFIGGTGFLWLEEREPEHDSVGVSELGDNFGGQIVVDNVFEINGIKLISPWVKNLEAFMIHFLVSEPLDILTDEVEIGLIGFNWITQIIFIDLLLWVSQERSNSFDARSTLQVLGGKELVQMFFEG